MIDPKKPLTLPFDPTSLTPVDVYKLMIGCIVPRPIAFVGTMSAAGEGNLAPFSFFNGVSANPPTLSVSISRNPDTTKKDTLRNIEDTKEFVVNSAHTEMLDAVARCGAKYPHGVDESEIVGLEKTSSAKVKVPRLTQSAWSFECTLDRIVEIGERSANSTALVLGRIVMIHVNERVLVNGKVDPKALDPLARLGGISYSRLGEILHCAVPSI